MKRLLLIPLAAAAMALTACADDGGYASNYRSSIGYDAYYDGHYGPYYNGYWGPDSYYYYQTGRFGRFHRDNDHHFSRDLRAGYNGVHGWHR